MSAPEGNKLRVKLRPPAQAPPSSGVVDLTDADESNEVPREQTNTHASGSGQQQPSEQLGKRPRPDSAHSGGKAAKKTAAGGPPWAVPTAAAEPSAARPQPAAPRQLMKIRFSTAQAAEAAPAAPQGGRGGGAEAAGAAEVPQPTRRATPSPPHERQQPGAAAAAAAAPAAAALGPSHAAASKKFVRHRAAEPAAAAANALTSVVAALRAENDALRAQLADAKEHLDAATAQADELEAEVETLTVRVDETHALLRRERWERSQEQQANEQWRRDTQSRVDSEHEIAAEATRRADTLQAQLDSVRTDPGAVLRHLRETAALAQLPGPRLSDLKDELDKARVIVSDVQAKRATEALKPLECIVCLDVALQRVAFGCGHAVCTRCEPRLARCPVCSAPIRSRLLLYL